MKLKIDTDKVIVQIDEKIYGHSLEHNYHACNGSLWGEVVWNRSFEEARSAEPWRIKNGCLEPIRYEHGPHETLMMIGDGAWRDYEFQVEVRQTSPEGSMIVGAGCLDAPCLLKLGSPSIPRHELLLVNRSRCKDSKVIWHGGGQIVADRWHAVRIRCTAPRIQAWLDGQSLADLDYKDWSSKGPAGIGTFNAQGQFRNIRVISVDGKPIIGDPPPSPSRHWRAVGAVTVEIDDNRPLNDKHCLMIEAESAGAGIQQNAQAVRAGDALRGSLWLRGSAPDGMVVRLIQGDRIVCEYDVPPPESDWRECPLILRPEITDDNLSLQVLSRGPAKVWIDQCSLMPDSFRATGGYRCDLLQAVADVRPAMLRWPGGNFVDGYRWKHGLGKQHQRIGKAGCDEHDPSALGIDEFIGLCLKTGAAPLIVVDAANDNRQLVQDACDLVEYCNGPADLPWGTKRAENGHPQPYNVKYWEVGGQFSRRSAAAYAEVVRRFVPAIRAIDPTIEIAVCGNGGFGPMENDPSWNEVILENCAELFDYLSMCYDESSNNNRAGPGDFEAFVGETARLIAASKNPKAKLFISHWGAAASDWRAGLDCAALLGAIERRSDIIGMASPSPLLRHVSAHGGDNALIHFNHCRWFPGPNYVVMQLYCRHFAPQLLGVEGDLAALNVVATKSANGSHVYLKAVNAADVPVDVCIALSGQARYGRAALALVAPDDLSAINSLDRPDAIRAVLGTATCEGNRARFTLPRWSVGVVTLTKEVNVSGTLRVPMQTAHGVCRIQ